MTLMERICLVASVLFTLASVALFFVDWQLAMSLVDKLWLAALLSLTCGISLETTRTRKELLDAVKEDKIKAGLDHLGKTALEAAGDSPLLGPMHKDGMGSNLRTQMELQKQEEKAT